MTVNAYFKKNSSLEQSLFQKIVTESIQVIGHDVYYLPRKLQRLDLIFGEDVLSKFDLAVPLEMYMENKAGGEMDLLSKFGLQVKEQIKYQVSASRWQEAIKTPYGSTGTNVLYNDIRPQEGDLIYEPLTTSLYEIMYVNQEEPYYQLGKPFFYTLTCELFNYSNEDLNTGIAEIDGIETDFSTDILSFEMLMEDGGKLLQESGDSLIQDVETSPAAQQYDKNQSFDQASEWIEWSASNPFGDVR
jgi:hypothetical protein